MNGSFHCPCSLLLALGENEDRDVLTYGHHFFPLFWSERVCGLKCYLNNLLISFALSVQIQLHSTCSICFLVKVVLRVRLVQCHSGGSESFSIRKYSQIIQHNFFPYLTWYVWLLKSSDRCNLHKPTVFFFIFLFSVETKYEIVYCIYI